MSLFWNCTSRATTMCSTNCRTCLVCRFDKYYFKTIFHRNSLKISYQTNTTPIPNQYHTTTNQIPHQYQQIFCDIRIFCEKIKSKNEVRNIKYRFKIDFFQLDPLRTKKDNTIDEGQVVNP